MYQLGGHALFLSRDDLQIGRGETVSDTAQTLSRYLDGMMIRTFAHRTVIELARAATVPVINGLTDLAHPCQVLADYQTVLEHKGRLEGLKIAYIGDGNKWSIPCSSAQPSWACTCRLRRRKATHRTRSRPHDQGICGLNGLAYPCVPRSARSD